MFFFFSSRRRHTRCALVTGVQTCALPISRRRDDLLLAAGPAARDALRLDLDDDDAVVVHHDRRLGTAQSVGDQFKPGLILSLSCPHLLCFAAILLVRTLFAPNFSKADLGTSQRLATLEATSRIFDEKLSDGRAGRSTVRLGRCEEG